MSSIEGEEITLRRAVLSDQEGVMSLGDMYGGRDYLFAVYEDVVEDPAAYPVVAVVKEKVVGFYMTTTFDGGVTVMKRAARVAETYRGRGLYQMMEEELERHTALHRPQTLYETLANTDKVDHLLDRFLSKGYKPIYRKGVINRLLRHSNSWPPETGKPSAPLTMLDVHEQAPPFAPPTMLNNQEIAPPTAPPTMLEVHEMSRQDLSVLFQAEISEARVFPKQRLFHFYLGYRLQDDNIPALLCKRGGAFYSVETGTDSKHVPKDVNQNLELGLNNTANSKNKNNNNNQFLETNANTEFYENSRSELTLTDAQRVAMVTFYYCFPTRTGFLHFLDIYAAPRLHAPRDHFTRHLQRHLVTARSHFPNKDGILTVTFDPNLSGDVITSTLDKLGITEVLHGQEDFQILYERHAVKVSQNLELNP